MFIDFYRDAERLFPLLPAWPDIQQKALDFGDAHYVGLNSGGLPIFEVPDPSTTAQGIVYHESGHAYRALLEKAQPGRDFGQEYWAFRGFPGTYAQAELEKAKQAPGMPQWVWDPNESWAECFKSAVAGQFLGEKTMDYGKAVDPLAARAFFASLPKVAPVTLPTPIVAQPKTNLTVLLQNSHRSDSKPDGWSGAPGEATYICDILNPRIVAALAGWGIKTVIVNGDMVYHPEYAADYLCFIAPHYDADVYGGDGGWFWGRAALSPTGVADDRLGRIIQLHYLGLSGVPALHMERLSVNVTDYYAFRWTTDKTPGVLVELGVGWGADKDWLRANVDNIAKAFADSVAGFAGISAGPKPTTLGIGGEDVAFKDDPDAQAYVADMANTIQAIKDALAKQAHHKHSATASTLVQTTEPQ